MVSVGLSFLRKALLEYMVVPSPQGGGYAAFFPDFPLDGIHSQTFDSVIPLEVQ